MADDVRENLAQGSTWIRILYMILFGFAFHIAIGILGAIAVIQALFKLFTGKVFARLMQFGQQLATYQYQIALYECFRTDVRPFPFADWPEGPPRPAVRRVQADPPPGPQAPRPD